MVLTTQLVILAEECGGGSKTTRSVEVFKTARSVEVFKDDEKSEGV